MISKLRGLIDEIHPDALDIDVGGVFYHVNCSKRTLSDLQSCEKEVTLFTEMVVREDAMTLYGFSSKYEKECFRVLTGVQGVGNKVGLAILSIAAPGKIFDAISAQDKTFISQAEGVGPKLASRIINELKDKVGPRLNLSHSQSGPGSPAFEPDALSKLSQVLEDAISALTNLGFRALDADKIVRDVLEKDPDLPVNDVIRSALSRLSGSV